MNSERKAFEEVFPIPAHWIEYDESLNKYYCPYASDYGASMYQARWEAWQASTQRQGYKLVPVEVLERAISHISIAMCHPNNTRNEEDIMHNDMVIIEKAMLGAVDE